MIGFTVESDRTIQILGTREQSNSAMKKQVWYDWYFKKSRYTLSVMFLMYRRRTYRKGLHTGSGCCPLFSSLAGTTQDFIGTLVPKTGGRRFRLLH